MTFLFMSIIYVNWRHIALELIKRLNAPMTLSELLSEIETRILCKLVRMHVKAGAKVRAYNNLL